MYLSTRKAIQGHFSFNKLYLPLLGRFLFAVKFFKWFLMGIDYKLVLLGILKLAHVRLIRRVSDRSLIAFTAGDSVAFQVLSSLGQLHMQDLRRT